MESKQRRFREHRRSSDVLGYCSLVDLMGLQRRSLVATAWSLVRLGGKRRRKPRPAPALLRHWVPQRLVVDGPY